MYQIFRMLFPLNNDTLILFLAKKLFCAGNEVVACVKKAEYETTSDSNARKHGFYNLKLRIILE